MKEVLINVPFRDAYTDEVYTPGKTYPMTEERVKEIKEVNPNFVTVVGNAKETKSGSKGKSSKKSEAKKVKATDADADNTEGDGENADDGNADGEDADGEDADGEDADGEDADGTEEAIGE